MKIQLLWNEKKMNELSHRLEKVIFWRQESGMLHNSVLWADEIFEAICSGDERNVQKLMERELTFEGEAGVLARNELRNFKNLLICSVAHLTFRIIQKQMLDSEMSYSISDACIQMVEDAKDEEELMEIASAFCLTFCRYVQKGAVGYHPLVGQAKEYIFRHFHEKIVVGQMAEQLGVSASYLGQVFRQNEGITLHEFIGREKVERAKNLLRYSDYGLDTISQYLGYSSQSHFGREFKKYTGDTPAVYRNRYSQLYRKKI